MEKLLETLINSGYRLKKVHSTSDGLVIDFSLNGKPHRIFVAPLKPVKELRIA